jgi:hypothetical protein
MRCMRWVYLGGALALAACEATPMLDGGSLLCEKDSDCGDGLRCFDGLCIYNTPPSLEPLDDRTAVEDQPFTLTASATDPEKDDITYVWRQLPGPGTPLFADTREGKSLTLTASEVGDHVFEVTALDPYISDNPLNEGTRVVHVMVTIAQPSIFVSKLGEDSADCGDYTHPCLTIGGAVAIANDGDRILVGAVTGVEPYEECLNLTKMVHVLGCYDPTTWRYDPALRPQCRVSCDQVRGHFFDATAHVRDLTLISSVTAEDATGAFMVTTVRIGDGDPVGLTPSLTDVDIDTAPCGAGCYPIGLASVHSSPLIDGVDVRGVMAGFDPVYAMSGMWIIGGEPTIRGDCVSLAGNVTCPAGGRGTITLGAAANQGASGISLVQPEGVTIDGVHIEGGLGGGLSGLDIKGGVGAVGVGVSHVSMKNSFIELTGFGARSQFGVIVSECSDLDWPCACSELQPGCTLPATETKYLARVELDGNHIELQPSALADSAPCLGFGINLAGYQAGHSVKNNDVVVGNNFSLALAMSTGGDPSCGAPACSRPAAAATVIATNTVTVGDSEVDPLCFLLLPGVADFGFAAIGFAGFSEPEVDLHGNDFTVGNNAEASAGAFFIGGNASLIEDNEFVVGRYDSGVRTRQAYGVVLISDDLASSTFARNKVVMGGSADDAVALSISGGSQWYVVNNYLHGGPGPYSTALDINTSPLEGTWPRVAHNSIHAGGTPFGLVSRAIVMTLDNFEDTNPGVAGGELEVADSVGVFANNVIDAGGAIGRRVTFDLSFTQMTSDPPTVHAVGAGNLVQRTGPAAQPQPVGVAPVDLFSTANSRGAHWLVAHYRAGVVTTLSGAAPYQEQMHSFKGMFADVFLGSTGFQDAVVTSLDSAMARWATQGVGDAIGVARFDQGVISEFTLYDAVVGTDTPLQPGAVATAEVTGEFPADVVFADRRGNAAFANPLSGPVFVMPGKLEGGYGPPVPLALGKGLAFRLEVPTDLAASDDLGLIALDAVDPPTLVFQDNGERRPLVDIDIGAAKISLAAVRAIETAMLGGESVLMVRGIEATLGLDVVLVLTKANLRSGPAANYSAATAACGDEGLYSWAVYGADLLIGCGDYTIERYSFSGGLLTRDLKTGPLAGLPTSIAARTISVLPYVLAVLDGTQQVQRVLLSNGATPNAPFTFLGDPQRRTYEGVYVSDLIDLPFAVAGTACGFADAAAGDLDLLSGSCLDGAASFSASPLDLYPDLASLVTTDLDDEDRAVPADVGADEVLP